MLQSACTTLIIMSISFFLTTHAIAESRLDLTVKKAKQLYSPMIKPYRTSDQIQSIADKATRLKPIMSLNQEFSVYQAQPLPAHTFKKPKPVLTGYSNIIPVKPSAPIHQKQTGFVFAQSLTLPDLLTHLDQFHIALNGVMHSLITMSTSLNVSKISHFLLLLAGLAGLIYSHRKMEKPSRQNFI